MKLKRRKTNAGMTLIELMLAVGIVGVTLSVVFSGLMSLSGIGKISESQIKASCALSSIMEEINTISTEQLLSYTPPEIEMPGYEQSIRITLLIPAEGNPGEAASVTELDLPVSDTFDRSTLPNPVEVRASIDWIDETNRIYRMMASTVREN